MEDARGGGPAARHTSRITKWASSNGLGCEYIPLLAPARRKVAKPRMMPKTSWVWIVLKPFCMRETSNNERREPFAVRICCRPHPAKSATIAWVVAEGGCTVSEYMYRDDMVVMMGNDDSGPGGGQGRRCAEWAWADEKFVKRQQLDRFGRRWATACLAAALGHHSYHFLNRLKVLTVSTLYIVYSASPVHFAKK